MNIVDSAVPLIIVETPTENTVPEIYNNTKFKISGYCYDSSGSKDIKIAYIPSEKFPTAVLKEARAKEIFQFGNIGYLRTLCPIVKAIIEGFPGQQTHHPLLLTLPANFGQRRTVLR